MAQLFLGPKGLAAVRKRVGPEEARRLDELVKAGTIKVMGRAEAQDGAEEATEEPHDPGETPEVVTPGPQEPVA